MSAVTIIPAIMSGGSGTRLWPMSSETQPKQFHALGGRQSMIVETAQRVCGTHHAVAFAPPMVICNAAHADLARGQLRDAGMAPGVLILEPIGRNTAATAVLAALAAQANDPDALVLLLPADHIIADARGFRDAIAASVRFAQSHIITFGIEPTYPSTGYGYINGDAPLGDGVFAISAFREKPDEDTARTYLRTGGYSWNAGIFLFHPAVLLAEFEALAPKILAACRTAFEAAGRADGALHLDMAAFSAVPSAPIDTAIMEKTKRGAVTPCRIGWTDVGSWAELHTVLAKDDAGNALLGEADLVDVRDCMVWRGPGGPRVLALGLQDLIIAAAADTVIILPRGRAQEVKGLWARANPPAD